MSKKKDWIQKAIVHKGSFTEYAKEHHETVRQTEHNKHMTEHRKNKPN